MANVGGGKYVGYNLPRYYSRQIPIGWVARRELLKHCLGDSRHITFPPVVAHKH